MPLSPDLGNVRRARGIGALGVATLLALTACSAVVPGTPVGAGASGPVGPVPPGLDRFYAQPLKWEACADYATDADSEALYDDEDLRCAKLRVPLDYAKPDGREISIGLLRKEAGSPAARIGALVMNPGGPGQSGMVAAAALTRERWDDPLSERFDLVGFDPRGVGSSEPAVKCLSDAEKDAERVEPPLTGPQAVAEEEKDNKAYAEKCAANTGADVLANVGTRDVVKDMDVLRSVLGERKLNYVGFSYGTRIGTAYAEAFPGNVRALVLDGAVDPTADRTTSAIGQANGFKKAFDAFAAACVTKQTCPLGRDAAQAEAKLDAMLEPLKANPIPVGARQLSYSDAMTAVALCLYSEETWSLLEEGLVHLTGTDGTTLLQLADVYLGRGPDGKYSNIHDVFTAVHCVDDPQIKDRAVVEEQARRLREGVPTSPLNDDEVVAALDECAFWPVPSTSQPHEPKVPGLPQVLVISSTGDPATPYEAGVRLAKALGASLLTVETNSHTAFLGDNDCVDDAGAAYLIELKLPGEGMKCS
ncbi:alpha/beta hydrolase [Kibdelosporangium persicum]|uniref:Pimeloyl-ACP methyl ester carboxylesterase n=1 Tax=Kibdelosporangium persicum TaxID=2698649 RepID=A0ABX2FCR9_9PSEU|nr:alpha/beta hydrolase [Kibdelosporangium persicum]NRN69018.1 Pimeloyl-ACP methyl ester carboxylesterase [Kibdelosporangium persicum]